MYSLQSGSQQKRENMTLYRRETSFSLSVAKIKTRQHVIKKLLNMFEVILEPHYKFFWYHCWLILDAVICYGINHKGGDRGIEEMREDS